jgi:hypothetical protein
MTSLPALLKVVDSGEVDGVISEHVDVIQVDHNGKLLRTRYLKPRNLRVFSIAFPNMPSPWRRENPTVGAPYSVGGKS